MSYEVRGAVEVKPARPQDPQSIDQSQVASLRRSFGLLNKQWIGVSFIHMSITMLLFSDGGLITTAAILIMVLGIDLALMWLSGYIEIQRRFYQPVGFFAWTAFVIALLLEFSFNTAALWAHRPDPSKFPDGASKATAVAFGSFVALIIYVSATVQSKLDRTRLAVDDHYAELRRHAEAQRQRDDEARQKREEAEAYRRQRAEEQRLWREEQERNRRLESHSETSKALPAPSEAAILERRGNGKAAVLASDVSAIAAIIEAAGVTHIESTAMLGRLCGWTSSSTPPKARDALIDAGILREIIVDGKSQGFAVITTKVSNE